VRVLLLSFFALVSSMAQANDREFQAPLLADRPIAYNVSAGSNWLNQWAADGFCSQQGFEAGAASYEPAGYVYGYTGEVIYITKKWSEGYSIKRVMAPKTDLFARITCR
jgi:hypothetical protein